jgi:hypothetical protein
MAWLFFLLTLIIELPVIYLFYKKDPIAIGWKQVLVPFFLLNLFTWPLLHIFLESSDINIYLLEFGVVIVEAIGYKLFMKSSWGKALLASLIANALSYFIGVIIFEYFF